MSRRYESHIAGIVLREQLEWSALKGECFDENRLHGSPRTRVGIDSIGGDDCEHGIAGQREARDGAARHHHSQRAYL
jgi:hypothetical protein